MTKDVVIRAEGLGKKYVIGHESERERYVALRDVLARTARSAWRKTIEMARGRAIIFGDTTEEFWALRDVNFEIKRGEVVGIIGRNGAGKTTLLKILSRITEPTEGEVTIQGRVASLLEVGTGFHPELTGRENVYLNGAILGMTRAEIRSKFDEIVAFSEVERFLDTPVKRYSSGMYVRLAFAVAAHLEPEILIVDEVLAVGDIDFQKKCLGKMSEVAGHGRTVLFVSHNIAAVQTLCSRGILLASGAVTCTDQIDTVVTAYLETRPSSGKTISKRPIQRGLILDDVQVTFDVPQVARGVRLEFSFEAIRRGTIHECSILIKSRMGYRVAVVDVRESGSLPLSFEECNFTICTEIPDLPLVEGVYIVALAMRTNEDWIELDDVAEISISPRQTVKGFVRIAADQRGVVELDAKSFVMESSKQPG